MEAAWFADAVGTAIGSPVAGMARLGGGDVAVSFRAELADGRTVFAKTHASPPPEFFVAEAEGLRWLGAVGALPVPEVLAVSDDPALLVLEWIDEGGSSTADGEAAFGRALADLHRAGAPSFGREDQRTTGSRRLPNEPCDSWVEFYAERRLRPLARMAADEGALAPDEVAGLESIADRLAELGGPVEAPARLHGDLWAGNRIVDRAGNSWLIDPAAHGGHREFDLAMMRLFGGFAPAVFAACDEVAPLASGWEDRVALHQLAPLTVHAVKFGGGYVGAASSAISRYR